MILLYFVQGVQGVQGDLHMLYSTRQKNIFFAYPPKNPKITLHTLHTAQNNIKNIFIIARITNTSTVILDTHNKELTMKELELDSTTMSMHEMTNLIYQHCLDNNETVSLSEDDKSYYIESPTITGLLADLPNVKSIVAVEFYLTAIAQVFIMHGASIDLADRWIYFKNNQWLNKQLKEVLPCYTY